MEDNGDGDDEVEENEGHEKIMWDNDGVGCKSMPMSLANVANL